MSRLLLLSLFFLLSGNALAGSVEQYVGEAEKYNNDTIKNMNEDQLKKVLDDYGKAPSEISYSEKELRARAETMMRESKSKANDTSLPPRKRAEAQAAAGVLKSYERVNKFHNLDSEATFRKSFMISENPLDAVKSECGISGEFDEKIDLKPEPYEVEVDDVRETEVERTCEEDDSAFHKCENVLKLTCKHKGKCLDLKDGSQDAKWESDNLVFGITGRDYWQAYGKVYALGDRCEKFVRKMVFEVKDKSQLKEFKIIEAGYKGFLRIMVNGTQVYNEPHGGEILEIIENLYVPSRVLKNKAEYEEGLNKAQHVPLCINSCRHQHGDTASSYNLKAVSCASNCRYKGGYECLKQGEDRILALNVDLSPYVKEGVNEIVTETVIGNTGHSWIKIKASQNCCNGWDEVWEEACAQNG